MITTNPNSSQLQLHQTHQLAAMTSSSQLSPVPDASKLKSTAARRNLSSANPGGVTDLHAEISTLKSARQTDAYLLSLKEREIAELRSLLLAKAEQLSTTPTTTTDSAAELSPLHRSKSAFDAVNNDSTATLASDETDSREAGVDLYLLSGLTKICDSPDPARRSQSTSFASDQSRLLISGYSRAQAEPSHASDLAAFHSGIGGVDMKRTNGLRFGSLESGTTLSDELDTSKANALSPEVAGGPRFSDADLECFRNLSLKPRTKDNACAINTDSASGQSSGEKPLLASSLNRRESEPDSTSIFASHDKSEIEDFASVHRSGSSSSELSHSQACKNIWGQFSSLSHTGRVASSAAAAHKEVSPQQEMFRQSSLNPRATNNDDSHSASFGMADDTLRGYKSYKFNLDPSSPAYVPFGTQFRPQTRVHSVPSYSSDTFPKSAWGGFQSKSNLTYPEFDEMVADSSLYPVGEGEYLSHISRSFSSRESGAQGMQSSFQANNHAMGGNHSDVDEYGLMSPEYREFGDAMHYQVLVEKIVQTNDQPASLNLQQNIKHLSSIIQNPQSDAQAVAAAIRSRSQLMDSVRPQALSLMRNRFGNFLMQRCLEFGTREQVKGLVNLMVGHIYPLSCDRFGCHVVQKALDVCEDDVKFSIVSELFRAIPETITHRFACHVWQRVFETKWGISLSPASTTALEQFPLTANMLESATPGQAKVTFANRSKIVQRVDAALKSQWHLVANDENGSLVVQCIFENCTDADKREIVKEVLVYAADIAKGQWGNWVIQHLLDNGIPTDKSHIFKVVARNMYSMSVDQFASKVVEKVLKSCQRRELYEIIDVVISPVLRESGCPGILEMMNNQYANYVVQHILTLSDPSQRDTSVRLIAPHLPVLRGSKYGQRVAAIVEKHLRTCQQRFGTVMNAPSGAANPFPRPTSGLYSNPSSGPTDDDSHNNNQAHFGNNCNSFNAYGNGLVQPINPLFNSFHNGFESQFQLSQQRSHQQQQAMYSTSPPFAADSHPHSTMKQLQSQSNSEHLVYFPSQGSQATTAQYNGSGHGESGYPNGW
ncbi:armadillo-type protein [Chytriomyces cf. hyalinus JEL632]|nr:armadillo-type protein [Chytriomyces cf. hyalinus JEL632]